MVASFLFFVSCGIGISALLRREAPFVPGITRWDLAVAFYLLSLVMNGLVDEQAVMDLLEQAQQGQSVFSFPETAPPFRAKAAQAV